MTRRWEKSNGPGYAYVYIKGDEVVVGEHFGSGHTDNAGYASRESFLAGHLQNVVRDSLGDAILQEVLAELTHSK